MRLASALLAAAVAVSAAAAPAPSPAPKPAARPSPAPSSAGEIRGRVTGPDGKPVAGAVVRAVAFEGKKGGGDVRPLAGKDAPATAKTAADGAFAVSGLKGKSFAVRVDSPGLAPWAAFEIPPGASLRVQLRTGLAVSGRIYDASKREPLPGATVRVWDRDASPFGDEAARKVVAGDDGRFRVADLPQGLATVEAWAPGKARARQADVVVRAAKADGTEPSEEISLFLQPGGRLAGRVLGADGKPAAGVIVSLRPASIDIAALRESTPSTITDADGRFALGGIRAGTRWTVVARKEGQPSVESAALSVEAGTDRSDVDLKLEGGATLKFRLTDAEGRAVADAEVSVTPSGPRKGRAFGFDGGSVPDDRIRKADDGTFTVGPLKPGAFDVMIAPERFEEVRRESVRLKSGETADLGTLRVREGRFIAGTVTDSAGQPVAGARIGAWWLEGSSARSRTAKSGEDGKYRLAGVGEGPLRQLWASAKGFGRKDREGVQPGDSAVDFVLERSGAIVGKVVLADGSVPAAFTVKAHREAQQASAGMTFRMGDSGGEDTFTDPSGSFKLEDVDPGTVTVEARARGKAPARRQGVKVAAEQTVDVGTLTPADGRTLRGRAVALADGAPVAGASILASLPQGFFRFGGEGGASMALSGADGAFEIAGLESRTYTLEAAHPDYAPTELKVDVPEGQDPPETLLRLSRGGTLEGTVRDASKQPVPGAAVVVMQGTFSGAPRSATTGPDGRYAVEKLPAGQYSAMRVPDGDNVLAGLGMKQATIREGEATTLDFDETAKITVSGRLLRGGKPIGEATLMFLQGEGGMPGSMKTTQADADGRYQVGLDAPGRYNVMVQRGGMFGGGRTLPVDVPDQPAVSQDLVLSGGAITVRVVGPDGKPPSQCAVRVVKDGAADSMLAQSGGLTESDGTRQFDDLDPGTYRVTASASGYRNAEAYPVGVAEGAATPTVELRLEIGKPLRGRVLDPQGRPVPQAMVAIAPAGGSDAAALFATCDVNGAFAGTTPSDGPIDVAAVAPGYAVGRLSGVTPPDDPDAPGPEIRLTRGGRVRVTVTGADGKPASGVQIVLRASPPFLGSSLGMMGGLSAATGGDGVTVVGPLTAASYEVVATSGTRRGSETVTVPEGGEASVAVILP